MPIIRSQGLCRILHSNQRLPGRFGGADRHNPERGITKSVFSPAARPGESCCARKLIRAGGLKTCWTKPHGRAVPQLWALQLGEELRGNQNNDRDEGGRWI